VRALVQLATSRPIGVIMLYLVVALLGVVSVRELTVDLLPAVDVPRISITTAYEGVAPEEVETLITRPLEQATSTVEGVEQIEATSSEGLSRVQLQFAWGTSLERALDDVRVAVDRARGNLPEDAEPPRIFKFDLSSVSILSIGVSGEGDPRRLKYLAEDEISRSLERVPGVASVDVRGGRDREIQVSLDPDRLSAHGLRAESVAAALARENRSVSAGDMRDRGREVVIRTEGELETLDDIRQVVVATRQGAPVVVGDLGVVVDSIRRVRSELWIDGVPDAAAGGVAGRAGGGAGARRGGAGPSRVDRPRRRRLEDDGGDNAVGVGAGGGVLARGDAAVHGNADRQHGGHEARMGRGARRPVSPDRRPGRIEVEIVGQGFGTAPERARREAAGGAGLELNLDEDPDRALVRHRSSDVERRGGKNVVRAERHAAGRHRAVDAELSLGPPPPGSEQQQRATRGDEGGLPEAESHGPSPAFAARMAVQMTTPASRGTPCPEIPSGSGAHEYRSPR
jgi:hypothetical protein